MEDENAHELSTITEVDTPATSRLNATADFTTAEQTIVPTNGDAMNETQSMTILHLLYKQFPDFHEYLRSISNIAQASETTDPSVNVDKLLNIESALSALNYQSFHKGQTHQETQVSSSSTLNLAYQKFPSHAEYAREVSGLLDSQSIDQMQTSESSSSSLPDILMELKARNLKHSFELVPVDDSNINDIEKICQKIPSASTVEKQGSGSLSDSLVKDLRDMGISWASSMIKKSKQAKQLSLSSTSTSSVSESAINSNHHGSKKLSPLRKKSPRKSSGSSFIEMKASSTDNVNQTNIAGDGKPVNLKDFLARELMKHSSTSSSDDSSLASIFLKSFLGHSPSIHSVTLPALNTPTGSRNADKQRTSTPVHGETSSEDRRSNGFKKLSPRFDSPSFIPTVDDTQSNAMNLTGKMFSGESHLSSVHIGSESSSSNDKTPTDFNYQQRKIEDLTMPKAMHLQVPGTISSSITTATTKTSST